VNSLFQLTQVASFSMALLSRKLGVPESLESKFSQVGLELENYKKTLGTLSKIPKHIAFAIMPEKYLDITEENLALAVSGDKPEDDNLKNHAVESAVDSSIVKSLAKEISWAYAASIHVVSLYDHQGLLRNAHTQLKDYVHDEIQRNINGILKNAKQENGFTSEVPVIKVFNADESTQWLNDLQGEDASTGQPILYIFIFSYDNGKEGVVDTIREVMKDNNSSKVQQLTNNNNNNEFFNKSQSGKMSKASSAIHNIMNSQLSMTDATKNEADTNNEVNNRLSNGPEIIPTKEIPNESKMDSLINDHLLRIWQNKKLPSEPEILIVHGDVKSTLGFLPWHIRLTEFSWISELKNVGLQDFTNVLIKYGHCNQKLGA